MSEAKVYPCKKHGDPYTVCAKCSCQYCPLYWSACPRCSNGRVRSEEHEIKTCEICKASHGRIGHRTCGAQSCLSELLKKKKANAARRERNQVLRDLGMTRVRGAQGGTYWE